MASVVWQMWSVHGFGDWESRSSSVVLISSSLMATALGLLLLLEAQDLQEVYEGGRLDG